MLALHARVAKRRTPVLAACVFAVVVAGLSRSGEPARIAAMGMGCVAIERACRAWRLHRLLLAERALTATLSDRLDELAALHDVGKAVNSVLALEDMMPIVLSSAIERLAGKSGSIMLCDGDHLEVRCEQGDAAARGARVRIGAGIAGQVAARREPQLVSGPAAPGRAHVKSAASVPLVNRGELLGVLNVSGADERPLAGDDLRALSLFAEHAAMAIANSRLYEAERDHVAKLVELDRLTSEFVATASHELRTPLTSILGCVRTLQRRDVPAAVADEFLEMIERQGTRLLDLIEDIMDAPRTAGAEAPARSALNVGPLLEELVRCQAAAGRPVRLDASPGLVALVEPDGLQRAFTNLVDNAFGHGGGDVEIEAAPSELDGSPAVEVAVLDRGPGVPPADREAVFERFRRGHGAFSPGMGLGLHLVKSLVGAMGGRVWVDDRPGGGAAFRVLLPAAEAAV